MGRVPARPAEGGPGSCRACSPRALPHRACAFAGGRSLSMRPHELARRGTPGAAGAGAKSRNSRRARATPPAAGAPGITSGWVFDIVPSGAGVTVWFRDEAGETAPLRAPFRPSFVLAGRAVRRGMVEAAARRWGCDVSPREGTDLFSGETLPAWTVTVPRVDALRETVRKAAEGVRARGAARRRHPRRAAVRARHGAAPAGARRGRPLGGRRPPRRPHPRLPVGPRRAAPRLLYGAARVRGDGPPRPRAGAPPGIFRGRPDPRAPGGGRRRPPPGAPAAARRPRPGPARHRIRRRLHPPPPARPRRPPALPAAARPRRAPGGGKRGKRRPPHPGALVLLLRAGRLPRRGAPPRGAMARRRAQLVPLRRHRPAGAGRAVPPLGHPAPADGAVVAGTAISAMQAAQALRRGVLVPFRKREPEGFKTAQELVETDKGGLTYLPRPGLHENAGELDFASMYPSLMVRYNISPETVNCSCCPGDALPVPGIPVRTCRRRRGLVPETIAPCSPSGRCSKNGRKAPPTRGAGDAAAEADRAQVAAGGVLRLPRLPERPLRPHRGARGDHRVGPGEAPFGQGDRGERGVLLPPRPHRRRLGGEGGGDGRRLPAARGGDHGGDGDADRPRGGLPVDRLPAVEGEPARRRPQPVRRRLRRRRGEGARHRVAALRHPALHRGLPAGAAAADGGGARHRRAPRDAAGTAGGGRGGGPGAARGARPAGGAVGLAAAVARAAAVRRAERGGGGRAGAFRARRGAAPGSRIRYLLTDEGGRPPGRGGAGAGRAAGGAARQHGRAAGFLDGSESPDLRRYEAMLREAAEELLGIVT